MYQIVFQSLATQNAFWDKLLAVPKWPSQKWFVGRCHKDGKSMFPWHSWLTLIVHGCHLLQLIEMYIPNELVAWTTHYACICNAKDCSTNWDLWLTYDIEIQCRSCSEPLYPAVFQLAHGMDSNLHFQLNRRKPNSWIRFGGNCFKIISKDLPWNTRHPQNHMTTHWNREKSFHPLPLAGICVFCVASLSIGPLTVGVAPLSMANCYFSSVTDPKITVTPNEVAPAFTGSVEKFLTKGNFRKILKVSHFCLGFHQTKTIMKLSILNGIC